jgi:hypothetical protein
LKKFCTPSGTTLHSFEVDMEITRGEKEYKNERRGIDTNEYEILKSVW